MRASIRCFAQDQSGATAIEYAIIASGIAAVIVAVVNSAGANLANIYTDIGTKLGQAGR